MCPAVVATPTTVNTSPTWYALPPSTTSTLVIAPEGLILMTAEAPSPEPPVSDALYKVSIAPVVPYAEPAVVIVRSVIGFKPWSKSVWNVWAVPVILLTISVNPNPTLFSNKKSSKVCFIILFLQSI